MSTMRVRIQDSVPVSILQTKGRKGAAVVNFWEFGGGIGGCTGVLFKCAKGRGLLNLG